MKNIHKLLAAALTGTLIISSIAGCTESSETEQSATDTQVTEATEETDTTPQLAINLGKLDSMTGTEAMKRHQVYTDNIQLKVVKYE